MSSYSLPDLCQLAGVTPRTVRFYISQGLLRSPSGGGAAARYDEGHLNRLRLIRQLQKEHLPLAEIRNRLAAVSDADVERLATEPLNVTDTASDYIGRVLGTRALKPSTTVSSVARAPLPAPGSAAAPRAAFRVPLGPQPSTSFQPAASEAKPDRSTWERMSLTPDIELHVRRPLSRDDNRRVDRLVEIAHQLFEEEQL
jgi:DNA-binding transcriptional MerR regulator